MLWWNGRMITKLKEYIKALPPALILRNLENNKNLLRSPPNHPAPYHPCPPDAYRHRHRHVLQRLLISRADCSVLCSYWNIIPPG